jgi:hypothetical protein
VKGEKLWELWLVSEDGELEHCFEGSYSRGVRPWRGDNPLVVHPSEGLARLPSCSRRQDSLPT